MEYNSFTYLYPPRPEKAIPKGLLGFYETQGWHASIKKNGTSNVIAVQPDKTLVCMTRHNDNHKLWQPTPASSLAFQNLPGKGYYVFCAELMHSKVAGMRDINFIHDILVDDGNYLVGTTFAERQIQLQNIFKAKTLTESPHYFVINPNTWLAKGFTKGFIKLYDGLTDAEDEGIIVKKSDAKLVICSRAKSNVDWQVKCRRETKNYGFCKRKSSRNNHRILS